MSNKKLKITWVLAFVLMAIPLALAGTQQGTKQPGEMQQVRGELLAVQPDSSTLVIRISTGEEMAFAYNEATAITGADDEAAGLATFAGSQVTVQYRPSDDERNLALQIHIE